MNQLRLLLTLLVAVIFLPLSQGGTEMEDFKYAHIPYYLLRMVDSFSFTERALTTSTFLIVPRDFLEYASNQISKLFSVR